MADEKDKNTTTEEKADKAGEKLITQACEAFGIDPKYIFAKTYDASTKTATIVTNGGSRVRYRAGDKVEPLEQIAITGINPVKRKPITGAGDKKKGDKK